MADVAILGYGNVGWGVGNVIMSNKEIINRKTGQPVNIKYIFDQRNFPGDALEGLITHDIEQILNDSGVSVIVEALGGTEPAFTFAKRSLQAGKSYVTSNKELVAAHGAALFKIAEEKNVSFLFEASVGGGVPIIRPLSDSLTADDVLEISGILNGTTNYILTKMDTEQSSFSEALADAQRTGYAESNPGADIDGCDAARKLAILLSMLVGQAVDYKDIPTEGIRNVSARDLRYAKKAGYVVKLIGRAAKTDKGFTAAVAPMLISNRDIPAAVNGVLNCIFVRGNAVGDLHFIGSGAGKLPTASAIIADIIDSIKHPGINRNLFWNEEKYQLADCGDETLQKLIVLDHPHNAVPDIINELYSPQQLIEIGCEESAGLITRPMRERDFEEKAEALKLRGIKILSEIRIGSMF